MGCKLSQTGNSSEKITIELLSGDRQDEILSKRFDDKYATGPIIGRGAYAEVRSCYSRETLDRFAVKIMKIGTVCSIACDSLVAEAEILKARDHPNIVKYVDFFETSEAMYLIEEFMPGGDLFDCIANGRHRFSEDETRSITTSLLGAKP
jgi:serine/threonine protein kinase